MKFVRNKISEQNAKGNINRIMDRWVEKRKDVKKQDFSIESQKPLKNMEYNQNKLDIKDMVYDDDKKNRKISKIISSKVNLD